MNNTEEFENFDRTMRDLMKVPHDELKAALEAEKSDKEKAKKRKAKEPSASGRADGESD